MFVHFLVQKLPKCKIVCLLWHKAKRLFLKPKRSVDGSFPLHQKINCQVITKLPLGKWAEVQNDSRGRGLNLLLRMWLYHYYYYQTCYHYFHYHHHNDSYHHHYFYYYYYYYYHYYYHYYYCMRFGIWVNCNEAVIAVAISINPAKMISLFSLTGPKNLKRIEA